MKKYTRLVTMMHDIDNSPTNKTINDMVEKFVDGGMEYKKALNKAIKRNRRLFEDLLYPDYDSNEADESDSENNKTEESDNETD